MKKSYSKVQLFGKNFITGQVFTNAPQLEQVLECYMKLQEEHVPAEQKPDSVKVSVV